VPFAAYLRFARANPRFLGFGFLAAFGSSFGQTYFIGVFTPHIQGDFALGHTAWGAVYLAGTLASAALLPWSGKQIDRHDLRGYTTAVCVALAIACAALAWAGNAALLIVGVFLLRHAGQGLMSHLSITSMARYFDRGRGRAIAMATLGFSAGEAVLPVAAVATIAALGWRVTYLVIAAGVALALLPVLLWLLKGHAARHHAHLERMARPPGAGTPRARSWTRAEVARDRRFYLILPGVLAPSLVLTALFFHHLTLADAKGWSHAWLTGSYAVYAAAGTTASLASGPLIDRFGAARLVPWMLAPLALAMVLVAELDDPWTAWLYLGAAGAGAGLGHTAVAALWAELYGLDYLGAIKSLAMALSVFATALGPVVMGALMDLGVSIEGVCWLFAGYAALGAALIVAARLDARPQTRSSAGLP